MASDLKEKEEEGGQRYGEMIKIRFKEVWEMKRMTPDSSESEYDDVR